MKSLYLRIYATVVVVLLLFAVVSGWVLERHLDQERVNNEQVVGERLAAWAELLGRSLPPADAPADQQASALRDWSQRLRVPLALDAANGERIFASESFLRRSAEGTRPFAFTLEDGRTLSTMRPGFAPGAATAATIERDDRACLRRGRFSFPGCRAAPVSRSFSSSSSSPSPPARIPSSAA
jgi:hypothetical protein